MSILQDGILAFFCAVGLTTVVWLLAELFFRAGRPAIPGLLLVLPVRGEAPAMEADMRELRRLQHQLPGTEIVLVDCGLSEEAGEIARYLAGRGARARVTAAEDFQIQ